MRDDVVLAEQALVDDESRMLRQDSAGREDDVRPGREIDVRAEDRGGRAVAVRRPRREGSGQ